MADSGGDSLKIYPERGHPSLIALIGGGVPSRNPEFATFAADNNRNVDLDEAQFGAKVASSNVLPGHGGHYDDPARPAASPVHLKTEIQSVLHSEETSPVTDINTISVRGNVIGFVYRTANGHMALQAAIPDGTTSKTNGSSWSTTFGFSKEGASAGVMYGQNYSTTTTFPTRGDVVPLTQLSQLPSNCVVQPLEGTHSRQLLPMVPHKHQDQFLADHPRPDAFTYEFTPMLRQSKREGIDHVIGAREGERVTLVNGRDGLALLDHRDSRRQELGRV